MLHDKEDQEGIRLMEATMIRAKVDNPNQMGVYVSKRLGSKYSAGELRELGKTRVELELQAMTCRFKRGKFGGWVVTLQRLESDPYLGKKEKVRLDVFKGKCVPTYRPDL
jgi:hypothetical protein